MGRPLIGDKPLTAVEKNRRYRQKRREMEALRLENDRLRTRAGLPARPASEDVPAAVVPAQPARGASAAAAIRDEEVNANGPIWAAVLRAKRMRAAGIPL